jgi:glycosyltransferase involved in cell wall biosynthesis
LESPLGISGGNRQPVGGEDPYRIPPSMIPDVPLVSIITPVYNGAKYLDELIQSVQAQDYPNIEHIIIDDGSTDAGATAAVIKQYPHLRAWSRGNLGQYATMNEGLEAARGEYVCFISADDLLVNGAVQSVMATVQENPGFDGVAGLTHYITGEGLPYPINYPLRNAPIRCYAYYSHIAHCSLYLARERLVKEKLFLDTTLHYVGDYKWMLHVFEICSIIRTKQYLSKVRIHTEQISTRSKHAMAEEHRRVVASCRINPLKYKVFTGMYIILHDFEKLRYAWRMKGIAGAFQLLLDHLHKKNKILT